MLNYCFTPRSLGLMNGFLQDIYMVGLFLIIDWNYVNLYVFNEHHFVSENAQFHRSYKVETEQNLRLKFDLELFVILCKLRRKNSFFHISWRKTPQRKKKFSWKEKIPTKLPKKEFFIIRLHKIELN